MSPGSAAVGGPYAGLRTLEISRGITGAYAGKLLADAGASVARGPETEDDPLRRRTAARVDLDETDSALFRYLHAGKQQLRVPDGGWTAASIAEPAGESDIVICDLGPASYDAERLCELRPGLVLVSVSPFGRTGPWAHRPATEFTLQAWCGSAGGRGLPERTPVQSGGELGAWTAGAHAAVAGLSAVRRARRTGHGELVDVSMLESMLLTQNPYGYLWEQLGSPPSHGPARFVETPSVEPTKDGYVGFCTVTAQQFQDFLVMIERPDLLDDVELATAAGRRLRRDEFLTAVHAWTTAHTTDEVLELADALRIPAVPVTDAAGIAAVGHFRERGALVPNPHGFHQPRVPYRISGLPTRAVRRCASRDEAVDAPAWPSRRPFADTARESGDEPTTDPSCATAEPPLRGLLIVDLTAFWAGPSATQLLAHLGADVVKVESTHHADPMRFTTARRTDPQWWEYGPVFHGANTGKRGVTLDLTHEEGRNLFGELVRRADVVVENFTPRVLDQLGIGPDQLLAWNPAVVVVRMPAFGLDGPWRDRPGFAQTMEQVGGLAAVTGEPDLPPMLPKASDPIAGVHAALATLIALEHRERTGVGSLVEVPMIETVLNVGAEAVVEYSAYGHALGRLGNRSLFSAPQGVYACAGHDEWIAVSVESDRQWHALTELYGGPDLPTIADRRSEHDRLDAELGAWFADQPVEAAVERLLAIGVPAAVVCSPAAATAHPQLAARGFIERLRHPIAGPVDLPGPPFRFASRGTSGWLTAPAPPLGGDNGAVLGGLLGLSAKELDRLRSAGTIGDSLL